MGGNQTAIFQQGEPLTNYEVVQKVPEHNISYLKHKTSNKQYMIREFAINDKTEFAQTCQKIKNRKKMESQYLTKLERYSQQLEDNLCSAFYKIFAMWEYPTHTLSDQISERALQKRRFQQNQIFSIIASVIEGMSCLQSSGIKHQCLTTGSILFDQTGTVKVADPLTSISPSNFDRINTNRKSKSVYISPEQCESLKNQRPIPNRNPYKSDVFVLGIIMLECGLLEKMESIFVEDFEDVDLEELRKRLDEFGRVYSKDLKLTVETMLTRDPKERMDWIGLKQYVPQKNEKNQNNQKNEKNDNDSMKKQNESTVSPFNSHRSDSIPQPLSQLPYQLSLGGGSSKPQQQGLSLYARQPAYTFVPRYVSQQTSTQPLPPVNTYGSIFTQPPSSFNQTFGQPSTSSTYPQPLSHPLPSFNAQLIPQPSTLSNTNYGYTTSSLGQGIYSNQKVSNYIVESKPSFERPTEEFLFSGNGNNSGGGYYYARGSSGVKTAVVDRESSSFPFNSQLEFKKEQHLVMANQLNGGTQPLPASSSSSYGIVNSTNTDYHPLINYPIPTNINTINTTNTSKPLPYNYPPYPSSSTFTPLPSTLSPSQQPPSLLKPQEQTISQRANSPFLSNHVKDAKSITYDKNLYSSYMTSEEKSQVYLNQQQQGNSGYSQQEGYLQDGYYHNEQNNNDNGQQGYNGNGYSNGTPQQPPSQYYQPLNKPSQSLPHYVTNQNSTPVLYQPLSTTGSTIKEKPIVSQLQQQGGNVGYTTSPSSSRQQHPHSSSPQQTPQTYQYKQINPSYSNPSSIPPPTGQQLEYVIEHFKQGSRYQGTKYQDMRHGQGKFFYQDGGMYEGNWKFNKMDGFGKLYYQSGKIAYEGSWSEDQFQGFGKLYNEQPDQLNQPFDYQNFDMIDQFWVFYEGNFVSDQKDGQGKMVFSNRQFFVGNFQNDMVDGPGEFHRMSGEVVRGTWNQNQLVEVEE